METKIIDTEPCESESDRQCWDDDADMEDEYPECFKVNPQKLCCKYCPAMLDKTCPEPCEGIYKDEPEKLKKGME